MDFTLEMSFSQKKYIIRESINYNNKEFNEIRI